MDVIFFIIIFIIIISSWSSSARNSLRNTFSYREYDDSWRRWGSYNNNTSTITNRQKIEERENALKVASPFLKPFKDLMGEHTLANENCKVNLIIEKDGSRKIICISKLIVNNRRKILTATVNPDIATAYSYPLNYVVDNLWNILCLNFSYSTVYENVYSALNAGMLNVKESQITVDSKGTETQKVYDSVSNTQIRSNNLLNINAATEAELSSLPGVNIVVAKKTMKYIEKNGGFKTVDEFIQKMKIKDIFADQIKKVTCTKLDETKPVQNSTQNGNLDIISNDIPHSDGERIIDL